MLNRTPCSFRFHRSYNLPYISSDSPNGLFISRPCFFFFYLEINVEVDPNDFEAHNVLVAYELLQILRQICPLLLHAMFRSMTRLIRVKFTPF